MTIRHFSMIRASVKAIVLGTMTDVVAQNIVALPILIIAASRANAFSAAKNTPALMMDVLRSSPSLMLTQLVIGALCCILGGLIAARSAQREGLFHGALSGFLFGLVP